MEHFVNIFKEPMSEAMTELYGKIDTRMYEFLIRLQSFDNEFLKGFMGVVSDLISPLVLALVALIIYWSVNKKRGIALALSIAFAVTVNTVLKLIFEIPRPRAEDGIKKWDDTEGYSFPSGHSQQAGTYAVFLFREIKKKWIGLLAGITFVLLTAFSRMYLGMHTPLDVCVGAILGVVITIGVVALSDYADRKNKPCLLYSVSIISGISMILFKFDKDLVTMTALSLGAVTGYLIDLKYINYKVPEKRGKKVIASITGLLLVGAVKGLFMLLPWETWYIRFADYGVFGFTITSVAPYLIKKILKQEGEGKYECKKTL